MTTKIQIQSKLSILQSLLAKLAKRVKNNEDILDKEKLKKALDSFVSKTSTLVATSIKSTVASKKKEETQKISHLLEKINKL